MEGGGLARPDLHVCVGVAKLTTVDITCVLRPPLRHRRLDLPTFHALQALMASGGLRVSESLAAAIRARREEIGIALRTLAKQMGVDDGEVNDIERGGIELSASKLVDLAQALNVDLVWFIEHEPSFLAGRDAGGPFDVRNGLPDPNEGLELMTAFICIKDPRARKAVLELAQRFAADDGTSTDREGQ